MSRNMLSNSDFMEMPGWKAGMAAFQACPEAFLY
jgi:hypothetical protein